MDDGGQGAGLGADKHEILLRGMGCGEGLCDVVRVGRFGDGEGGGREGAGVVVGVVARVRIILTRDVIGVSAFPEGEKIHR